MTVALHANSAQYDQATTRGLLTGFSGFLDQFARSDSTLIADVAIPLAANAPTNIPEQWVLPSLFPRGGNSTSALSDGDRMVTVAELDRATSQWARELIGRGLGTEDVVAVAVPRSVTSVVAFWAVAKSGACYLPVDPKQPTARIRRILHSAQPSLVLTMSAHAAVFDDEHWPCLAMDETEVTRRVELRSVAPVGDVDRLRPIHIDSAAYLITTSGSTGTPKGVVVSHAGLAPLRDFLRASLHIGADSIVALAHQPAFDASLLELLSGATLAVMPPDHVAGPMLGKLLDALGVTVWLTTPAVLETIDDPAALPLLRTVVVGGEACPPCIKRRWSNHVDLIDSYGLTETTVVAIQSEPIHDADVDTVGAPLPSVRTVVLDRRLRVVPVGAAGELYVGGSGVARGYRADSGTTATRFVPDPFLPGKRLYRTGDRVRQRTDGSMRYLGRTDTQLNVRGIRIEPAEIEAALESAPGVERAFVVVDGTADSARIVGYVTPATGDIPAPEEVVLHARRELPTAATPAAIVVVDDFPLTANGKIDRERLPAPTVRPRRSRPPIGYAQHAVSAAMAEVTGNTPAGMDDDFFTIGGNSLLAVRLCAEIGRVTGSTVPLHWVYEEPTVAGLAARIATSRDETSSSALATILPISTGGDRTPVFCVHSAVPLAWSYLGLARHLPDRRIYGLQLPDAVPLADLTVEVLAAHYVREIEGTVGTGPCALLGWSIGGQVAHEVAVRLRSRGHPIVLLALLDTVLFTPGTSPPIPSMRVCSLISPAHPRRRNYPKTSGPIGLPGGSRTVRARRISPPTVWSGYTPATSNARAAFTVRRRPVCSTATSSISLRRSVPLRRSTVTPGFPLSRAHWRKFTCHSLMRGSPAPPLCH